MKKLYALILLLAFQVGFGQITEGFESGLPTSYSTGSYALGSGTWVLTDAIRGTTVNSGSYSLQLHSATGSNAVSPNITCGVNTVTFWARGSAATNGVQVNYSTDGGTTWIAAGGSPFAPISSSFTQYTATINNSAANILIQFYRTAGTIYIDDVVTTCYSSVCSPPTANTNTLAASGVSTTSLTLNWGSSTTSTNGSNEVVVISTNSVAPSPSSGTVYTVGGTMGAGYTVVYNGVSAYANGSSLSQGVTGLTCGTTYYMYVIEYNNTGTGSPCYKTTSILKGTVSTSTCPCVPPTTSATGVNLTGVSTGSMTVNWSSGNGTNELVIISLNSSAPSPSSGTSYTGNTTYGSGSTVGTGYYTIYSGAATSSVNVTGLSCGTPYYVYVFEYNTGGSSSPCYYATSVTGNTTTSVCGPGSTLPQLTGIITDACDLGACDCGEGSAEATFLNSGSYSIDPTKLGTQTIQYYGSSATTGFPITGDSYSGSFSSNASTTSTLNSSTTTCTGVFVDAYSAGTIPQNSTIMMVPYNFCPSGYDFSTLCSSISPIYVLYFATTSTGSGTAGVWADNHGSGCSTTAGNYGNHSSSSSVAYIEITIPGAALSPASSTITEWYTYNKNTELSGNGAAEGWSGTPSTTTATANGASTYTNSGSPCKLPLVLPVNLLSFTANKIGNDIALNWVTETEENNNYFEVEYSYNGEDYFSYSKVKGAENNSEKKEYSCLFIGDLKNTNHIYFRLKQVDFNGKYQYSSIIIFDVLAQYPSKVLFFYNSDINKVIARFKLEYAQSVNISIYNTTGEELISYKKYFNEGNNEVQILSPDKPGVYLLVYQAEGVAPVHQKIMIAK